MWEVQWGLGTSSPNTVGKRLVGICHRCWLVPRSGLYRGCGGSPWQEAVCFWVLAGHTQALGFLIAEQQKKPSWQAQSQCQSKKKKRKKKKAKPTQTAGPLVQDIGRMCPVQQPALKGKRSLSPHPQLPLETPGSLPNIVRVPEPGRMRGGVGRAATPGTNKIDQKPPKFYGIINPQDTCKNSVYQKVAVEEELLL